MDPSVTKTVVPSPSPEVRDTGASREMAESSPSIPPAVTTKRGRKKEQPRYTAPALRSQDRAREEVDLLKATVAVTGRSREGVPLQGEDFERLYQSDHLYDAEQLPP